jgi:hypothetical protein
MYRHIKGPPPNSFAIEPIENVILHNGVKWHSGFHSDGIHF